MGVGVKECWVVHQTHGNTDDYVNPQSNNGSTQPANLQKWEEHIYFSLNLFGGNHKVLIYKEYHSVYPLVGIGTLPTPLSPASVPLPP
jgi:hypothetical protein